MIKHEFIFLAICPFKLTYCMQDIYNHVYLQKQAISMRTHVPGEGSLTQHLFYGSKIVLKRLHSFIHWKLRIVMMPNLLSQTALYGCHNDNHTVPPVTTKLALWQLFISVMINLIRKGAKLYISVISPGHQQLQHFTIFFWLNTLTLDI